MSDLDTSPGAGRRLSAFISHHSSQVAVARRLKGLLRERGIDGWLAPDDIAAGTAFDQAILDQIARSDAIVLLFCAQSDQSRHVKRELMLGEDGDKVILPVRLEDVSAQGLAYWLKDYQWIDWFAGEEQAVERIVAAMTGAPAKAARAAPVLAAALAPLQRPHRVAPCSRGWARLRWRLWSRAASGGWAVPERAVAILMPPSRTTPSNPASGRASAKS
ncbi:toll/interleukin-1 receptor domain-containing protein [Sphingopyxis sp. PET50]|uniref:toll/interleukin-1 receptor domain-containing protein n=1 Tax=Sphingopyxis sp. PET50 TaxID=2976533 RepID=UPI0021AFF3FB|nr:toll/interleukin-1 receptor domain-containing protein [Sphingopyxis sp. PET50]